jgi:hypothetical protein
MKPEEEKKTDEALTELAKAAVNQEASTGRGVTNGRSCGRGLRSGKTLLHALRATAVNYQGDAR